MNKIIQGHVLDVLSDMESESVDCCITSPPYWGLRSYGTEPQVWDGEDCQHEWGDEYTIEQSGGTHNKFADKKNWDLGTRSQGNFCLKCNAWRGELGLEPDFNLYIKHLIRIFNEVKRVLKKTGSCWINLGDSYNNNPSNSGNSNLGNAMALSQVGRQQRLQSTIQSKSLCQIPQRFSIAMTDNDWILRNTIIWHKPNCMPQSANDRFTVDFEYIYFFTKSQKYYFQQQFEKSIDPESFIGRRFRNPNKYEKEGYPLQPHNFVKTIGKTYPERNKRSVWTFPTQPSSEEHFASYPNELVRIPIEAGCPKNGTVLDPFSGTGTTLYVAKELGRNYIGIDLKQEYNEIADKRLRQEMLL